MARNLADGHDVIGRIASTGLVRKGWPFVSRAT